MLRRLTPALLLLATLALPAPAAAQAENDVFLRDGEPGRICISETYEETCGNPLLRDDEAALIADGPDDGAGIAEVVGVVPAAAARVELRFGPRTVTVPVSAPVQYRGRFTGRIAVFRARRPDSASLLDVGTDVYVRDAAGALIGVAPGQDGGYIRSTALQRLRIGSDTFAVDLRRRQTLRPTVLDLGHQEEADCLTADADQFSGFALCFAKPPDEIEIHETRTCQGRVVLALTPADTTVVLVRADGRRVAARTAPFDARRTVSAFPVAADMAVRRLELTRSGRTTVAGYGLAAPRFACDGGFSFGASAPDGSPRPTAVVTGERTLLTHLGNRLRAAGDQQGRLCLALDDEPFLAEECRDPDRGPGLVRLTGRRLPDGSGVVAGIVRTGTPAVRVRTDALVRRVATVPVPDEAAGPYAGLVRGLVFRVPPGRDVMGVQALDATGRVIDTEATGFVGFDDPPEPFVARRARRLGALGSGRFLWSYGPGDFTCLAATSGRSPRETDPTSCLAPGEAAPVPVTVAVPCATRRPLVLAIARGRTSRLTVTTEDGRVRRAVPRALGDGLYGHALVLPSTAVARTVTVRGGGRKRTAEALPMAAGRDQCGYDGFLLLNREPATTR